MPTDGRESYRHRNLKPDQEYNGFDPATFGASLVAALSDERIIANRSQNYIRLRSYLTEARSFVRGTLFPLGLVGIFSYLSGCRPSLEFLTKAQLEALVFQSWKGRLGSVFINGDSGEDVVNVKVIARHLDIKKFIEGYKILVGDDEEIGEEVYEEEGNDDDNT
jgi:hypothetical protein